MAQLVIPPGFAHMAMTVVDGGTGHKCVVTDAFGILATPWTQANTDALFTDLANAFHGLYDSEWTIGPLDVLVGNDGPLIRFEHTGTSGGTRTAAVTPPPQVTYLVKKQTGFAGRAFRGRSYWPFGGPQTAINEDGTLGSSEATTLALAASSWYTALNHTANNTNGQVLLHSATSTTTVPTPVVAFTPERSVATQRRRLKRL